MTDRKMTVRETKGRAKHSEFILLAGVTLRGYGFDDLAVELERLAPRIRGGEFDFDTDRIVP